MIDETYNPNDPEFLASRALNEQLTDKERALLDRALAESPELRAEVQRLGGVSDLIARWAAASPEIDWETHAKLIDADVVSESELEAAGLEAVDRLVGTWGSRRVELNEEAFTASVLDRIAPEESTHSRSFSRMVFRVGAPLAAAAVIVLAVSLQFFPTGAPGALSVVSIGPIVGSNEDAPVSDDAPQMVVSFARAETPESVASTPRSSFRFVSIHVSPQVEVMDEALPL